VAYMPRLKTALTGARRCTTWAASRPPRDTAMAWPAGSRAMLATTMPSYRFSASRAPWWGSRSPAISEAAVSTSRAASRGHTDRSQLPGSSTTTAMPARRPAVTTSPMNQRSRGGSPLKVIPPFGFLFLTARPGERSPAGASGPVAPPGPGRRSGPGGCSLSSGSGGHRFRLAQLRAAGVAEGGGGDQAAAAQVPAVQRRDAQLRAVQSTAPHLLAPQLRASHCWAAQLLADQPSTVHRRLSQGWAVQASVSVAPAVGPGSPSAGAQRSPSAPPERQPSPSGGSDGAGGGVS